MHPVIFQAFDEICRARPFTGAVLEVGATPDASTLLNLPALTAATEKVGINKAGPGRFGDFEILAADANAMTCFPDRRFDVVLCNSVIEHDPFFWRSVAEMQRVTKPGGLLVIGAPGYGQLRMEKRWRKPLTRLARLLRRPDGWAMQHSTLTLGVHNFPGDYYRFSEQAFREAIFAGMRDVQVRSVMVPPRIIGSGIKP